MTKLRRWFAIAISGILILVCSSLNSGCWKIPAREGAITTIGNMEVGNLKELQPEAGIDAVSIGFHVWSDPAGWQGLALVVVSDAVGSGGAGGNGGHHASPDGRRVEWKFQTRDGKTGSATINDKTYDLAQGSLFLVSTTGADIRVLQLDRDLLKVKKEDIQSLVLGDKDIPAFFANADQQST